MNKDHENKTCGLEEDPDFTVDEIGVKAASEDEPDADMGEEKISSSPGKWKLIILPGLMLICLLLLFSGGRKKKDDPAKGAAAKEDTETVSVTEAEKDDPDEEAPPAKSSEKNETKETAAETETDHLPPAVDLSWQNVIFGDYENSIVSYPISISGLTENEKNLTGFRESDFVKSLSSFLSRNNIKTGAVTFTGSIACSARQAAAYTAKMKGIENRKLVILFFPGYPGKYLFALENTVEEKKEETKKQTERPVSSQNVNVPSQQIPQTAPSQPQMENEYDAMNLKLTGISSELGNYLSNPYELQYGLYDYLYNKGIRNAKSASVSSYYIDSEDRLATIQIDIAGVGSVTAIYDPGRNEYEYQ